MALLVAWPHRRRQRPVVDVRGLVNDRVTGDARSAGRDAVTGFASRTNPATRPAPVARGSVNERATGYTRPAGRDAVSGFAPRTNPAARPAPVARGSVNERATGYTRPTGRDMFSGFAPRTNPAARPQPVARGAVNDRVTGDPWSTRSRPPQRPAWPASRDASTGFTSRTNPAARPAPDVRGALNERVTGDPWSARSRPPQRPTWPAGRDASTGLAPRTNPAARPAPLVRDSLNERATSDPWSARSRPPQRPAWLASRDASTGLAPRTTPTATPAPDVRDSLNDRATRDARSTGRDVLTGLAPRTTGLAPRTTGLAPHTTGLAPHTTGLAPRTTGLAPHTTGLAPRTTGLAPRTNPAAKPQPSAEPAADAVERPPFSHRRFRAQTRQTDLHVLLITEGTYPFHFGGVSTWCRNLITGLPTVDFHILALVANPDLKPLFELPGNASALTTIPIWGVHGALETSERLRLADLRRARHTADQQTIADGLARPLGELVKALLSPAADPFALADQVNALYEFFLIHDFDSSMRSAPAWEAFTTAGQRSFPAAVQAAGYGSAPIGASDVVTGLHWLYHWLLPLSRPLPEVDVAHATMAGECILPAIASKLHHGAGLVFSQHGVHLREAYLREAADDGSLFLKLLKIGFARRTSEMAYAIADQISTCCDYNKRWAPENSSSRVQTIHYGLDAIPANGAQPPADRGPVITWLGRIDPLKDIETLLRAAAIVVEQRGDAVFRLYGSAAPDSGGYRDKLLALRHELGLDTAVELAGYTSDPQQAYGDSEIVVLTSISEGFPYATLEAMGAGKPVVATAVGGLPEQLGDWGVLVEPQNPKALAAALIDLIDDPSEQARLGAGARERVRATFNLAQKNALHLQAYAAAARGNATQAPSSSFDAAHTDARVELHGADTGALVESISAQVPHPVDHREIAAVLEANGVTDAVADARYGARDAFQLAAAILPQLPRGRDRAAIGPHRIDPPDRQRRRIPRAADGLLLLVPAAVIVSIGLWVRSIHGWTSSTSRALLLGVTASTLLGTAFQFAIMRRGALLIGCARWSATRKFLSRWSWVALFSLLCADLASVFGAAAVGKLSSGAMETFGLSFAALIALWILSGGLVLVRRAHEVGLSTLAGVIVAVVVYYASGAGSTSHLEIALAAGYGVTMASIASRVMALLAHRGSDRGQPRLPRLPYLLREAAPFVVYGGLLIVLVLGPNLVTALRASSGGSSEWRSIAVGMTLALVPAMLSIPLAESALYGLSSRASAALSGTSIAQIDDIGEALHAFHRRQSLRYLTCIAVLSLIAGALIWLLAGVGAFSALGVGSRGALVLAFAVSALGYLLLARAHFDLMPAITLGRPDLAVPCLLGGVAVMLLVASVAFAVGFVQAGPISLIAGSAASAVLASKAGGRLFARVTRHIVGAM
jgi:glycosyltransferase involved in cell wall biosynthesis